ncbi:Heme:hemopexin utilization protein A [Bordetella ansorpii]|uniref:Heme:hemopexin utilization protein A n=1 Tax=Bordetella ansorpii TaxID=288768 RepID=A0A157QJK3_9BORD|nr:filamentous haemagglutinin family protein [Bordetella ansorpii]SAI46082.1 Heme:hemopexin utilization protein A [Bordetella ansorpii]
MVISTAGTQRVSPRGKRHFMLAPTARAVALALAAGGVISTAHAQQAGGAWFATGAKDSVRASQRSAAPNAASLPSAARQQAQSREQLSRSLANLNRTANVIAAQQAAQSAGRANANNEAWVRDGVGVDGLNPLADGRWDASAISAPGMGANGRHAVAITQNKPRAILEWQSFNVGRNTDLTFNQAATDAVLNVVKGDTRPSQIQGSIQAAGTVMVVNQNGVVFSGTSQVNVRNLVAAAARTDDALQAQFLDRGLYSLNSTTPTFSAVGDQARVLVQAGARISTAAPSSSTEGGGYVLLAGRQVENAGHIYTPGGQTTLAAGDSFVISRGQSSTANAASTTRGNEVAASVLAGSSAGTVINRGLIVSPTGDITLTGSDVTQAGAALSSTTVNTRGTIHLNAVSPAGQTDAGRVTLADGSASAILVDGANASALDGQRDSLLGPATSSSAALQAAGLDRRDLSRVEIQSAGTVDFQGGSLTLATGGQVAVKANARTLVRDGAIIDVAGAIGVAVAMESNAIKVNIQGNEQRDASVNRDSGNLNSTDVWVDVRDLVYVPAGTNGYANDRWYTAGGLLEVGGYLGTQAHATGEWLSSGGIVRFEGAEVVTQAGSQINLSGGTLDVQAGYLPMSWLRGANGGLYEVSRAPGDMLYDGLYQGYESTSERWGVTTSYYSPLIAPSRRWEAGYTVGRDAGTLVIGTSRAVLEGDLVSDTYQGARQSRAAQAGLDGYQQGTQAVARRAQLIVGSYTPYYYKEEGRLGYALDASAATVGNIVVGAVDQRVADGLDLDGVLPESRQGTLYLDSTQLNSFGLGSVRLATRGSIIVNRTLQMADGGDIVLFGPQVDVRADLVARSGSIQLGNVLNQVDSGNTVVGDTVINGDAAQGTPWVKVAQGVTLDASGLRETPQGSERRGMVSANADGGSVSVRGSGDVTLAEGSVVDVSAGAAWLPKSKLQGGRGGDVTLAANAFQGTGQSALVLGAELRGHGMTGAGTLRLESGRIQVGGAAPADAAGLLHLDPAIFQQGFAAYTLLGHSGLSVADGTRIDVARPVLRNAVDSGAEQALSVWTPPLSMPDAKTADLNGRAGADIRLQAGSELSTDAQRATTSLRIGDGAQVHVDPGHDITLAGVGEMYVGGVLQAQGGSISIRQMWPVDAQGDPVPLTETAHARAIRLAGGAMLDVSGYANIERDLQGRRYGEIVQGGSIVVGGRLDTETGTSDSANLFVVIERGAQLLADGASGVIDVSGQGAVNVTSAGGSISLGSNNGLVMEGTLRAAAGGAGAAGGTLSVALDAPQLLRSAASTASDAMLVPRELVLAHGAGEPAEAAYGQARLDMDAVQSGGFGALNLLSNGIIAFDGDVSLAMGQGLGLYTSTLALTETSAPDARVTLAAPYVRLAGAVKYNQSDITFRPVVRGTASSRESEATLRVQAGLIDLRDEVQLGVSGQISLSNFGTRAVDRRGFAFADLDSSGDIRLLTSSPEGRQAAALSQDSTTVFWTPGDLRLAAAQIYPTLNAQGTVRAGTQSTLRIDRNGDTLPAMPASAFGRIAFEGGTIEQAGVVRAPMGNIDLGGSATSARIVLLPGSVTSASGAGVLMPYGGTTDGLSYQYEGANVRLYGMGGEGVFAGLRIGANSIDVRDGAVIDLSGGGELRGAGFITGRGGSSDARYHPLIQNTANGLVLPGLDSNPVYAIVPGVQAAVAPVLGERGAVDPAIGQQVTIGAGVPGLPAGTYTLMPSTYALMPGAFRVELNGAAQGLGRVIQMRNGSWATSGSLSVRGTGIGDAIARSLIVTPADTVRRYSQYNETSYADFVHADAALKGVPRAMLEADARSLVLSVGSGLSPEETFRFDGIADFTPGKNGLGGTVSILADTRQLEILPEGRMRTDGFIGASLSVADLNALHAPRLLVGRMPVVTYGQGGNLVQFNSSAYQNIVLREGATLRAAEVMMNASGLTNGSIVIEQGASINTLGQGLAPYDSSSGFIYDPVRNAMLAVSNGWLEILPPTPGLPGALDAPAKILIGGCAGQDCTGQTELYAEGTLALATDNTFELGDSVRFGARKLGLAVGTINVGTQAALADAALRNALPGGLTLNQQVIERLLRGDAASGAPALEELSLSASQSIGFYGDVELNTLDAATGRSTLDRLVLGAPAFYGAGAADERAVIRTGSLVWTNLTGTPGAIVAGGAGTGLGKLDVYADTIVFGPGPNTTTDKLDDQQRMTLGFTDVTLTAAERITGDLKGGMSVYQSRGAYVEGSGFSYSGGNLNVVAPLWTGEAGSVQNITAGGTLRYTGQPAVSGNADGNLDLGAELVLAGQQVVLDGTMRLPSGKLTVRAEQDLTLGANAMLDLAGRTLALHDVTQYSWGGDLILESRTGNIAQEAASRIDLSAQHHRAGTLQALALGAGAGRIDLQGAILGSASGRYDAGGTWVPYSGAEITVRAQTIADFSALNERLTRDAVFGARSFQIKQGDLVIGDELRAGRIDVSVDNGSLTVAGRIDASGERVGSIRLAAGHNLTIAGTALLDAHSTVLRVDSYGKIIDSPNRATVELATRQGTLTLADGARIDLRHGTDDVSGLADGRARGTLTLNAPRLDQTQPRLGDIAIDARGALDIQGARDIIVLGTQRYTDAYAGSGLNADGNPYQYIDQGYLDAKHLDSVAFIDAALGNASLMQGKLAGLNDDRYREAFHLRPGVEIVTQGDLMVRGDVDLSGYRYTSVNPRTPLTTVYGSGESGNLVLRAGGNLDVMGSITDGFMPPDLATTETRTDGKGWLLIPGVQPFGNEVVIPIDGVTLAEGTFYPAGRTLNFALPFADFTLAAGLEMPTTLTLSAGISLGAGTLLQADIHGPDGALLYAAGTLLTDAANLPAGSRLGAGTRLSMDVPVLGGIWPEGVALPTFGLTQRGELALAVGSRLPADTDVKLPQGVDVVNLRPEDANGQQGRNWAIATLLPQGTQSWSIRLVAGADTGAADNRLTRPDATNASLRFSDPHFIGSRETVGGGGPEAPYYVWASGEVQGIGEPGTRVDDVDLEFCVALGWCELFDPNPKQYVWASGEVQGIGEPGTAVTEADLAFCIELGWCIEAPAQPQVKYVWASGEVQGIGEPGTDVTEADLAFCIELGWCLPVALEPEPARLVVTPDTQLFSVMRTGAGDLDLIAGGDVRVDSLYGIYTAGAQSASLAAPGASDAYQLTRGGFDGALVSPWTLSSKLGPNGTDYEHLAQQIAQGGLYAAWYPEQGGNVLVSAGGDLLGNSLTTKGNAGVGYRAQMPSNAVGNWLWRQGTGTRTDGGEELPTAWWINFGAFTKDRGGNDDAPFVTGFTGIGTMGGGNLDLRVQGDAGIVTGYGQLGDGTTQQNRALNLAIGSTGRVAPDGSLVLTGGGDIDVRVGGGLNPLQSGNNVVSSLSDLSGVLVNLRGNLNAQAGSIGTLALTFGSYAASHNGKESRAYQAFTSTTATAQGGVTLMPGDATVSLQTRGDLVVQGTGDAGRVRMRNTTPFDDGKGNLYAGGGTSTFSLWTDATAIDLMSAGGNMTPFLTVANSVNTPVSGARFYVPAILRATAPAGSLYYGGAALGRSGDSSTSMVTAPSVNGQLQLIAGDSIYAAGHAITQSGGNPDDVANPLRPAFAGFKGSFSNPEYDNYASDVPASDTSRLFTFGVDQYSLQPGDVRQPVRFYAMQGDIIGLRTGEILTFAQDNNLTVYQGSGPLRVIAGRDIVNAGMPLGTGTTEAQGGVIDTRSPGTSRGNLIVHSREDDVSLVSAGRDILLSTFEVAGPGQLEVVAGRNVYAAGPGVGDVYQESAFTSLGSIDASAPPMRGASIAVVAGAGAQGPDYGSLLARYLDPARQAEAGRPLADQPGSAVRTYAGQLTLAQWLQEQYGYTGDEAGAEAYLADQQAKRDADTSQPRRILANDYRDASQLHLVNWLQTRFGYADSEEGARAYFDALPAEQQRIYARQLYFAEIKAGGREYNDEEGPRFGSYLRSREAIDTLFPASATYSGSVTMYGGAGIRTLGGGGIQVLTPGGQQLYGIEGTAPPSTAGVITQGEGDIELFSRDSILLGQSRIMTTFGGNIMAWSATGDINAGRGSKTTVVYTPPRRTYDAFGNVTVSPVVPSTGAGIASLAPIPEVPGGDIDLIAPLGTIDAGEAGVRASGNINIAALTVVNAANIQVQGDATGIPVAAVVNTGALTNASAASTAAAEAAQDSVARSRAAARQSLPSIISVQVLGFGNDPVRPEGAPRQAPSSPEASVNARAYHAASLLQVVGEGDQVYPEQQQYVSARQQRQLQQGQ